MSIKNCSRYFNRNFPLKVVEIGVRYGEGIDYMLKNFQIDSYHGIDPFVSYPEYAIDGFDKVLKVKSGDYLYNQVLKKYSKVPQITLIRKFSDQAHDQIKDESVDICFIDGNHEYSYVLRDLKNYYSKVKKGGIICGDDYFMRSYQNDHLNSGAGYPQKMVFEAVNDFFKQLGLPIIELGLHRKYPLSWLVIKQ